MWSPLRCSALTSDRTAAIRVESHAFGTAMIFTPPAVNNISSSQPRLFTISPLHTLAVHNITSSHAPTVHNITSSHAPGIDNITYSRHQRFPISLLHCPICSQYHLFTPPAVQINLFTAPAVHNITFSHAPVIENITSSRP